VRFGFLLERALALGADRLATGHYAQVTRDPDNLWELRRGVDRTKDQSYVLHRLDQEQLARAMFPVGGMSKTEVRRLAARHGLPTAGRKDSVDLCWVGDEGVRGFLQRHLAPGTAAPGPIADTSGKVLGRHAGLAYYTEGQRRGLGVAAGRAVYVVRRDFVTNTLVVGEADDLAGRRVRARDFHWIAGRPPSGQFDAAGKIRYGSRAAACRVDATDGAEPVVTFQAPQRAPTPGQGLVLYDDERVLGGGVISSE
jgi:tRNA-specific 2-thiouridylase